MLEILKKREGATTIVASLVLRKDCKAILVDTYVTTTISQGKVNHVFEIGATQLNKGFFFY